MRWLLAGLIFVAAGCDTVDYAPPRYRVVAEGTSAMRVLVRYPDGGRISFQPGASVYYSPWLRLAAGDRVEAVATDTTEAVVSIMREDDTVVQADTAHYADVFYVMSE